MGTYGLAMANPRFASRKQVVYDSQTGGLQTACAGAYFAMDIFLTLTVLSAWRRFTMFTPLAGWLRRAPPAE